MLTISLLGAPDINWNETPVHFPRRQARALLYRLAADARPVPREQLIYLFWPDVSDARARKNLSRLVSFLGKTLPEPGLLTPGNESIGLDASRVSCDVREFSRLIEEGDSVTLEQAVAIYRDSFLSGFRLSNAPEFENWTITESERLERRFLKTLAQLMNLNSSFGDYSSAIHYGQRFLATDSLAEEIHRKLITLYTMSGDRTSALQQYELCVAELERELGVAPLPETRAAYEAALADQGTAVSPAHDGQRVAVTWTVLPSLELPLIGRQEAMKQLQRAFERAQSGGFIFISGEPGVGKSRLLMEFASSHEERLVLVGNGFENERDLPYQPIVQALRSALSAPDLWLDIRPIWLAEVAAILPEVAGHFDGLPDRIQVEPEQAQARLFEAIAQVMMGLASHRPLLLCLDDLHWADTATLAYLAYLVGRLPNSGIRIMATFRAQEAESLTDLRRTLRRAGLQDHVTLSGLAVEAISAIFKQIPTSSDPFPALAGQGFAAAIHRATSGNAFFVLETIRYLIESGQPDDPITDLPLPPTVHEAVRGRLARLDPLSRQVLEAAAILSPEISFQMLGPVAGRSEDEVVDGLETLINRQLLAGTGEDLHFQHELARVVVYEDLSHWRRRLLHRRTAEALEDRRRGRQDQAAAQIARHYESAGEIELACSFYRDAAGVAQSLYAYREANHYLQRIIKLKSEDSIAPQSNGYLYESLGDNLRAMSQFVAAEEAFQSALRSGPPGPTLWQASVLCKMADVVKPDLRFQEANRLYEQAFVILDQAPAEPDADDRQVRLRLQFGLLDLYYSQARLDDMMALMNDIEPVVHNLDSPSLWSQYYSALSRVVVYHERFDLSPDAPRIGRRGLEYALQAGDRRFVAERRFGLGFMLLWAGELDQARETLLNALAEAEDIGHPYVQIQCLTYLGILHRLRGEADKTRHYASLSSAIVEAQKHRFYVAVDHSFKAWLAYRESDWSIAALQAREALSQWAKTKYPFKWLANWILLAHGLEKGDLSEAATAAAGMLSPEQQRLPDDVTSALELAVAVAESDDSSSRRASLAQALTLAKQYGYL